jgi:hypothetical protein
MPIKEKNLASFTQADGAVEVLTPSWHDTCTQVSFSTDSTVGTVAVEARYFEGAEAEPVLEDDGVTQVVIDLTDIKTFQLFDKWVYSFVFTPTSVDATYTPLIASGDIYRNYSRG